MDVNMEMESYPTKNMEKIFETIDFYGGSHCFALKLFTEKFRDQAHFNFLIALNDQSEEIVIQKFGMAFIIDAALNIIEAFNECFTKVVHFLSNFQPPKCEEENEECLITKDYLHVRLEKLAFQMKVIRKLYKICNENRDLFVEVYFMEMVFMNTHSLIPMKDEMDNYNKTIAQFKNPKFNKRLAVALEERNQLTEEVQRLNKHLHDIIKKIRITIYEINTMLGISKSFDCDICKLSDDEILKKDSFK